MNDPNEAKRQELVEFVVAAHQRLWIAPGGWNTLREAAEKLALEKYPKPKVLNIRKGSSHEYQYWPETNEVRWRSIYPVEGRGPWTNSTWTPADVEALRYVLNHPYKDND